MSLTRAKFLSDEKPIIVASKKNKKQIYQSLNKHKLEASIIFEEIGRKLKEPPRASDPKKTEVEFVCMSVFFTKKGSTEREY